MSYSRSYSRTVSQSYSKTVSVSYPASKDGGSTTQTVSGTVEIPVNIEIYVDTDKFDKNVDSCCNSVSGLNAAVVATTAQEIYEKREASKRVGHTIVKGFFDYISYELTQLKSELSAKCDSIFATLLVQKGACGDKGLQMQGDYERIASRYLKLFGDLDNELASRIKSIDSPIFNLERDVMSCSSRTTDTELLGVATVASTETAQLDAILSASLIKSRAQELINRSNHFLTNTYQLQNCLRDMLLEGSEAYDFMIPVVYVETKEQSDSVRHDLYGGQALPLQPVSEVEVRLKERFQDRDLSWQAIDVRDGEQIDSYFENQLNSSGVDPRVASLMMELKSNNKINVIKNR